MLGVAVSLPAITVADLATGLLADLTDTGAGAGLPETGANLATDLLAGLAGNGAGRVALELLVMGEGRPSLAVDANFGFALVWLAGSAEAAVPVRSNARKPAVVRQQHRRSRNTGLPGRDAVFRLR